MLRMVNLVETVVALGLGVIGCLILVGAAAVGCATGEALRNALHCMEQAYAMNPMVLIR